MRGKRVRGRLNTAEGLVYEQARLAAFDGWRGRSGQERVHSLTLRAAELPDRERDHWLYRLTQEGNKVRAAIDFLLSSNVRQEGEYLEYILPVQVVYSWRNPVASLSSSVLFGSGGALRQGFASLVGEYLNRLRSASFDGKRLTKTEVERRLERLQKSLYDVISLLYEFEEQGYLPGKLGVEISAMNRRLAREWAQIVDSAPIAGRERLPMGPAPDLEEFAAFLSQFSGKYSRIEIGERPEWQDQDDRTSFTETAPRSAVLISSFVLNLAQLWEWSTTLKPTTSGAAPLPFQFFVAGAVGYLAGLADACAGTGGEGAADGALSYFCFDVPPSRETIMKSLSVS